MSEEQINEVTSQLSDREMEILRLVATGASNKEIAGQLFLSVNTIKVHLRNIFGKIGVQSRTEATLYAVRRGWVTLPEGARQQVEEPALDEPDPEPAVLETLPGEADSPLPPEAEPAPVLSSAVLLEPEPVLAPASVPLPGLPLQPLPWSRRIALVLAVVIVAAGLGMAWPRLPNAGGAARDPFIDTQGGSLPALNASSDSRWQVLASIPTPRSRLAFAALRDKLYAIGGTTSSGVTGAVEIYDVARNTWSSGASKPIPVANVSAVVVGDKIMVPGGYTFNGSPTNAVEFYSPVSDTWSSGATLPAPLFAYALSVYSDKVYVFGGTSGRGYLGQVLMYDPATDRWSARKPMPTPRGFAAAAVLDKAIYVVGGYDGKREFTTCERYLPDQDAWETCAPLTVGRGGLALVSVVGRLFAVGGGWSSYMAFGEKYDPAANRWSPVETPISGEWRNLSAIPYRGQVYTVGGWSEGTYLNTTEKYSPFPFQIYLP